MIKVAIVDDVEGIRHYLTDVLDIQDISVVWTAASGTEAVEKACAENAAFEKPDVILMDIQMESRIAGIKAIEKIHAFASDIKCVVLTIHKNDEFLFSAYLAGASDYIVKDMPPDEVVRSIREVAQNQLSVRPEAAKKIISEYKKIQSAQSQTRKALQVMMKVSTSEYEILQMLYNGETYRSIAKLRYVEQTTIRVQVSHILKKFGKRRMKDVIAMLKDLKIFDEGEDE